MCESTVKETKKKTVRVRAHTASRAVFGLFFLWCVVPIIIISVWCVVKPKQKQNPNGIV